MESAKPKAKAVKKPAKAPPAAAPTAEKKKLLNLLESLRQTNADD